MDLDLMVDDYTPVACAFHERLEFAVLRRRPLRLRFRDAGVEREVTALPLDVFTRDGAEWLRARSGGGEELTLRLDRLLGADEN